MSEKQSVETPDIADKVESMPVIESELTPLELAQSWLNIKETELGEKLRETEWSLRWTRSYEMRPIPARPSYIEYGTIDWSDWETAEGEYDQWLERRPTEIQHLEDELESLYDQQSEFFRQKELVEKGNQKTIEELAALEKERREELKRSKELETERKEGVEFEGIVEITKQLNDIAERAHSVTRDQRGESCWNLKESGQSPEPYVYEQFDFEHTTSPETPEYDIWLRLIIDKDGYTVVIHDFREGTRTQVEYLDEPYEADQGTDLYFIVREGKVYDQTVENAFRLRNVQYPTRYSEPCEPEERFVQTHFDRVSELVESLALDIKGLA